MAKPSIANVKSDTDISDVLTPRILNGFLKKIEHRKRMGEQDKFLVKAVKHYKAHRTWENSPYSRIHNTWRLKRRLVALAIEAEALPENLLKKYKKKEGTDRQKEAMRQNRLKKDRNAQEKEILDEIKQSRAADKVKRRRIKVFYALQRYPQPTYEEMSKEFNVSIPTIFTDVKEIPKFYGNIADKITSEQHVRNELARLEADMALLREKRHLATSAKDVTAYQREIVKLQKEIISLKKESGLIVTVEQRVALRQDNEAEEDFEEEFWDNLENDLQ